MAKSESSEKYICQNKTARLNYSIDDTFEAGIVLVGTEVKSLREGRANLKDSYAMVKDEEVYLHELHISPYTHGNRYNHETLQVRFKDKNIADVLDMTVETALDFFDAFPKIKRRLQTLQDVGLGYIRLGQPAPTLSGGEAQRVKLSKELSRIATGRTMYVLDEPSVGLHAADVHKLVEVLQSLVDSGNTVLIIEHNMDIIKVSDWIIDLGPDGGINGGEIVAQGTPEQVCANPKSYTGKYLQKYVLKHHNHACKV